MNMATSTAADVSRPTTSVVITATAGAVNEDRFDPFLPVPSLEPAVEELSLQQSMDVNKECKLSLYLTFSTSVIC